MFLSSVSFCRNDKCSKKDSCLRYTTENDNIKSETYLVLTEEECNKSKSYINKDDYYKKMIMNIMNCGKRGLIRLITMNWNLLISVL